MRTTLAIDDDVLAAARGLAALQRRSVGEVISSLAREALTPRDLEIETRNGVPLLPLRPDAKPVTLETINALRDELP
ncbi:MAG: hypothetical protein WBW84_09300 [Acidobacteriaceae bacterium]